MAKRRNHLRRPEGWPWLCPNPRLGLCLVACLSACASTPSPKPAASVANDQAGAGDGSLAPLSEQDRQSARKAGDQPTSPLGPPDELALSGETSRLLMAAVQTAGDDPDQALQLVSRAADENPRCYQCFYNKAVLLERQNRTQDALTAYRQALAIHPTHLASLINASNIYLRAADYEQAQHVITRAIKLAPKDLGLRNQLVVVLLAANKLDAAAEQAKGVLQVDERNVDAMISLANVYYQHGKFELAERILLKAQEIDKGSGLIPNRLGFVYLKLGDPTSAIAAFRTATERDPNLAEAFNNLGVLYNRAHDYGAAADQFRRAIAIAPQFAEAYLNLGNALRGSKQLSDALAAYHKVLSLEPKNLAAVFNLGLLYLDDDVDDLDKIARFQKAEEHLLRFEKAGGRNPNLAAYLKEAAKKKEAAIKAEQRRQKREAEKQRREEEKRRKEEEELKRAEQARKAEAEAAAQQKAEEARKKAEAEAAARQKAEEARKKAEAEAAAQQKAEEARKKAEAEAAARRKAKKSAKPLPGSKLSGGKDEESQTAPKSGQPARKDEPPPKGGKLGGDEK